MNLFEMERFSEEAFRVKLAYVDICEDLNAGILLGQIIYWFLPNKDGESKLKVSYKGRKALAKARNEWYDEIRMTERQYDRAVSILKEKGFVDIENSMFNGSRTPFIMLNEKAVLDSIKSLKDAVPESSVLHLEEHRYDTKRNTGINKSVTPLTEITSETTTNINNSVTTKVDNMEVNKKESDQPNKVNHSNIIKDIITYLNDKTGKRYSHNASGNKRIIQARLNEGYTLDDFKRVIDHKCNEWLPPVKFSNGKMSDTYLRPATLFNQKFDQYLNESPDVEVKPKTNKPSTFQGYF